MTDITQPHLVGDGPIECSASQTVQRFPTVIVDTNAYYATLGVDVRATKRDLMRAYIVLDGSRSARLTYIIKLLLDPARRRVYDGLTLGELHMDPWVCAALWQRGLQVVDEHPGAVHDDPAGDETWPWAWYRWETNETDPEPLIEWQAALLSHLGDTPGLHFAVGLHGSQEPVVVRQVGYRIVVFLRVDCEPGLADVASAVHQLNHAHTLSTHSTPNKLNEPNTSGDVPWLTPSHPRSVPVCEPLKKRRSARPSPEPPSSDLKTKSRRSSASSPKSTRDADTSSMTAPSAVSRCG